MKGPIVYGTLYLDRGETREYAFASIKRMSARKPGLYLFDIICRKDQALEAGDLLPQIHHRINELNPTLTDREIHLGITTDPGRRPAEKYLKELFTSGIESGINISVADLNPARPPR